MYHILIQLNPTFIRNYLVLGIDQSHCYYAPPIGLNIAYDYSADAHMLNRVISRNITQLRTNKIAVNFL